MTETQLDYARIQAIKEKENEQYLKYGQQINIKGTVNDMIGFISANG